MTQPPAKTAAFPTRQEPSGGQARSVDFEMIDDGKMYCLHGRARRLCGCPIKWVSSRNGASSWGMVPAVVRLRTVVEMANRVQIRAGINCRFLDFDVHGRYTVTSRAVWVMCMPPVSYPASCVPPPGARWLGIQRCAPLRIGIFCNIPNVCRSTAETWKPRCSKEIENNLPKTVLN